MKAYLENKKTNEFWKYEHIGNKIIEAKGEIGTEGESKEYDLRNWRYSEQEGDFLESRFYNSIFLKIENGFRYPDETLEDFDKVVEIKDSGFKDALTSDFGALYKDKKITKGLLNYLSIIIWDDSIGEQLGASWNRIGDLEDIVHCNNLRVLQIFGNSITNLTPLKELNKLAYLCVSDNNVTDISPLLPIKSLKYLFLDYNRSLKDIQPLASLKNLEWLDISHTQVTDINVINNFKHLRVLSLSEVKDLTPLKNLKKLELVKFNSSGDILQKNKKLIIELMKNNVKIEGASSILN